LYIHHIVFTDTGKGGISSTANSELTTGLQELYDVTKIGERMSENTAELLIELSLEGGEAAELARQLRGEVEELNVHAVEEVSLGAAPEGTKALDMAAIGQMAVTLAPTIIPPLFDLLKSWVERKPSTPVKIRVKVGNARHR
jgi:hypothetical protein